MMPRYHFHITDGDHFYRDHEGVILRDLDAVRSYALKDMHDLRRNRAESMRNWTKWRFEITDGSGQLVLTIPFSDAVDSSKGRELT